MEVFAASSDNRHYDHQSVMVTLKRKRSQRQQMSLSPLDTVTTNSSSSHGGGGIDIICDETAYESTTTTEEEEDLANCLILLSQSGDKICDENNHRHKSITAVANDTNGFYGYECRTCNKTFHSFQALGGHRASHKIAKIDHPLHHGDHYHQQQHVTNQNQKQSQNDIRKAKISTNTTSNYVTLSLLHDGTSLFNKSPSSKIHECSICGSRFSSGQALGGHMRRHRTLPTATQITTGGDIKKHETDKNQRNVLSLDLNLPAPDDGDDHDRNKCMFHVFPPPTLIDCHF